jgi:hypothetical protein
MRRTAPTRKRVFHRSQQLGSPLGCSGALPSATFLRLLTSGGVFLRVLARGVNLSKTTQDQSRDRDAHHTRAHTHLRAHTAIFKSWYGDQRGR